LVGRKAMLFLNLSGHDADVRRAKVRIWHRAAAVQGDHERAQDPGHADSPENQSGNRNILSHAQGVKELGADRRLPKPDIEGSSRFVKGNVPRKNLP
jgi:hypothetical protein